MKRSDNRYVCIPMRSGESECTVSEPSRESIKGFLQETFAQTLEWRGRSSPSTPLGRGTEDREASNANVLLSLKQ